MERNEYFENILNYDFFQEMRENNFELASDYIESCIEAKADYFFNETELDLNSELLLYAKECYDEN